MPNLNKLDNRKILLDTHIFLWSIATPSFLTLKFRKALEKIRENEGILISAMSIWELGMLESKKRIKVDADLLALLDRALNMPGINLCPITPRIAIQSSRLPWDVQFDPVDRLLIASALEENAVLVTQDEKILDCGKSKLLYVHDPSL